MSMKKTDLLQGGEEPKKEPVVGLRPGIISSEILERIVGVMSGHGVTDDEVDYALSGVYVYGSSLILEGEV